MTQCANCSSHIPHDDSSVHYFVNDVSPEIISYIEQQKGAVFTDLNDEICQTCFTNATERLYNIISYEDKSNIQRRKGRPKRWSAEYKQVQHNVGYKTSSSHVMCVWCGSSLQTKRTHALPDGPERKFISEIIHPRQIPPGGLACHKCWVYANMTVKQKNEKDKCSKRVKGQRDPNNACVNCSCSLSGKRKHYLSEGPIREEIAARIFPKQIPDGGIVCYACWLRARRFVEKRQREENASREEAVEPIEEQSEEETKKTGFRYISLSKYNRLHGDHKSCVAECARKASRAPLVVRCRLLANQNLYLPGSARLCNIHCHPDAVLTFHKRNLSNKFTGDQIADMLFLMKRHKPLDADNVDAMDQHVRRMWLGVTCDEFLAKSGLEPSIPPRAIAIRLCAMTSGESPEVLASLFQLPRKEIDHALMMTNHLNKPY